MGALIREGYPVMRAIHSAVLLPVVILALVGCSIVQPILGPSGPPAQIKDVPGKYAGVDGYYDETEFSYRDDRGGSLEGVRWKLEVMQPGKFRMDVTGPEVLRMVSDGTQMGVQTAGASRLSLQPLPDPLRFYHIEGILAGYKSTSYLSQSLVLPWVFREMESQADLLLDGQIGVEVGTYWGEECVVYSYGDESVKRLWRGKQRADGGLLRLWLSRYENKLLREEWQVRLVPDGEPKREVTLTYQHRNVRIDAVLEEERFALEPLPVSTDRAVASGTGDPSRAVVAGTEGAPVDGAGGTARAVTPEDAAGPIAVPSGEGPPLPEGARGEALSALIRLLRGPNPEWATGAAAVLHANGRPEGLRSLADWVNSRQMRWVGWAARAATDIKAESLKEGLQAQTRMGDGVARVWVYRALYALGDTKNLDLLEDSLKTSDVDVQIEATQAIAELKSRAVVNLLIGHLGHGDPDLRVWAAHALGEIADGRAREALEGTLARDSDAGVRVEAALALRKIADPRSRPVLEKAITDDAHKPVRAQAAGGAYRLGNRGALLFLLAMLKSSSPDARHEALLVLGSLQDPEAAPALQEFVGAEPPPPDSELEEAAIAMGKIAAPTTIDALRRLLSYEVPRVRLRAAAALAKMKEPAAQEPLRALLRAEDPEVVFEAAKALLATN